MSRRQKPNATESERRLRHNVRLARLLRFLQLILGRGLWNVQALMTELECSQRTVHRMRETLELAGVPIWFAKELNAYQIRPDFRFPILHLSADEALGQAAATALSASDALGGINGARSTTRKLADTTSETIRRILDDATSLIEILNLKIADHERQRDFIPIVQRALLEKRILTATYKSPHETRAVTLKLHPYRLALIKQAWYLIARPGEEHQPRTFRVVRFQELQATSQPADRPDDFDLRAYLGNAWAVYRGERSYRVELRFTADAAPVLLETTWHHTQRVKKHRDGAVTLTFQIDGLNEVARWVVGWAGRVQVIQPPELRKYILGQHRAAIEKNSGENSA